MKEIRDLNTVPIFYIVHVSNIAQFWTEQQHVLN